MISNIINIKELKIEKNKNKILLFKSNNILKMPFLICNFFGYNYPKEQGEFIWETIFDLELENSLKLQKEWNYKKIFFKKENNNYYLMCEK